VDMVEIFCTHLCKWKNETCWNYSRNGGEEIKENDGGGKFKYDEFLGICRCHNGLFVTVFTEKWFLLNLKFSYFWSNFWY
jgi:hypothetical protein